GLIVAGHAWTLALVEQAAIRTIGLRRAGQVRLMRLFPFPGLIIRLAGRHVDAMMHPAMPAGRNRGGISRAIICHIAPIGLLVLIVAVTEFVRAHIGAEPLDPEPRTPGIAAPP